MVNKRTAMCNKFNRITITVQVILIKTMLRELCDYIGIKVNFW